MTKLTELELLIDQYCRMVICEPECILYKSEAFVSDTMIDYDLEKELKNKHGSKEFGNKLISIIEKKGLSQAQLSIKTGIDESLLSKYISGNGIKNRKRDTTIIICLALGLNTEDANKLLKLIGYTLNDETRRDYIIGLCLNHHLAKEELHTLLEKYNEVPCQ